MSRLDKYDVIFFDFDGVIKESVSVKTDTYLELFSTYGKEVRDKIKKHHLANGGLSRYVKVPIYLKWAGLEPDDANVREFCDKFGDIAKDRVIASAWVPGVEEFLKNNREKYLFILVSATPQRELEYICQSLGLAGFFTRIYGAPNSKAAAIRESMCHYKMSSSTCLMIGDSEADLEAARRNGIQFILRKHRDNQDLHINSCIETIENFHF